MRAKFGIHNLRQSPDIGQNPDCFFFWSPYFYNPGQNIWNKIEKSSKAGQDKKSLISTSAYFLIATAKVEFVVGRLGTRLCLPPNLRFP